MQINKINRQKIDGKKLKIVVLLPYFNEEIGTKLFQNVKKELLANNVNGKNIILIRIPGTLETPLAAQKAIKKYKPNAVIALGAVIRGETGHYDLVCNTAFQGLMKVQLNNNTPIIFGILTCENLKQAKARIVKGKYYAQAALEMAIL